jgi:hypothetical protein
LWGFGAAGMPSTDAESSPASCPFFALSRSTSRPEILGSSSPGFLANGFRNAAMVCVGVARLLLLRRRRAESQGRSFVRAQLNLRVSEK